MWLLLFLSSVGESVVGSVVVNVIMSMVDKCLLTRVVPTRSDKPINYVEHSILGILA